MPSDSSAFALTGRTALITGSSRGIGARLAEGLSAAGAHVVVHGRNAGTVEATARRIADATGNPVDTAVFDVTDEASVDAGIGRIEATLGTVDVLVNNAGMQLRAPLTEFPVADWNTLIATNLTSAFLLSKRVAAGMIARGSGRIVNIGSVQSQLARPGITPYSATKGGIVMLTKGLCADLAPHGITANAVAPGYFATELTQALVDDASFSAWVAGRTPAGRWGDVADLVGPVVFLASDAAAFVNGQILYVDGGMTAVI
jgi:gluconate 5-dehydrogenase